MQTGSYLELALTIYAWQVSNRLAEMIVASGLIYLPLLFIVWRNWSQPARSQEAKSAAPVSLRRMEQDVIVLFFTIIFAFLPAVSVTTGDIYYKSPTTSEEITGSTPNLPYSSSEDSSSSPESIKIPILWWVVHQASAGFVQLFVAGVNSFGESTHIRAISLALNYAKFNDPQLVAELQRFDKDCYLPALAKLEASPRQTVVHRSQRPRQPEWRGDDFWFDTPGFYDHLKAEYRIDSWAARYDWDTEFGPVCAEWWRDTQLGLESRLYSSIQSTPVWQRFPGTSGSVDLENKRKVVKGFLQKSPPDIRYNPSGDNQAPGSKNPLSPTTWLGEIGIMLGYIMTNTAMYIVTIGLPMVQAIILACLYIALPIAVPFATLRPGLLVFFISALFSLKFLTALWALSKFIDERMIGYMYNNTSNLVQLDSNDTVLSIITTLSYVGLPIVWVWLMSSFTGKGVEGVNLLFAYTAAKAEGAAQQAASVAQTAASKGMTAASKGKT